MVISNAKSRNFESTVYVGNLEPIVSESLLWELMIQFGRVQNLYMPKDRITQKPQGYAFLEYSSEIEADYVAKVANGIKFCGKPLRVNKASIDRKLTDVGATLFIGNLDPLVDEKMLQETFGIFGAYTSFPQVMRDTDTGASKGFAFLSFDNFDSSDAAIETMDGQIMMNKPIKVTYALKKDGSGARHGDETERLLAAQASSHQSLMMGPSFPQLSL